MNGAIKKIVYISLAVVFACTLGFIFWSYLTDKPQDKTPAPQVEQKENTVRTGFKETTKTIAQYVPKANHEDADVELIAKPKPLKVSINGKTQEVPTTTVKEDHKLDNGKLVVTEERQVVVDLVVPEQPKFKKGVYIENDLSNGTKDLSVGVRASYQTKEFDVDLKADLWKKKSEHKRIEATVTKWF